MYYFLKNLMDSSRSTAYAGTAQCSQAPDSSSLNSVYLDILGVCQMHGKTETN